MIPTWICVVGLGLYAIHLLNESIALWMTIQTARETLKRL